MRPEQQLGLFDALEHGDEHVEDAPSSTPASPNKAVEVRVRVYVPGRNGSHLEVPAYRRQWRYRSESVDSYLALLERTQRAAGTTILVEYGGAVAEHRTRHADGTWQAVFEGGR